MSLGWCTHDDVTARVAPFRVEIVCKQRGWVPGEIVAFDQASGTCKVLIEDFCLGSAQVDAQIPSSAIHICSADAPLIVEVSRSQPWFELDDASACLLVDGCDQGHRRELRG